jgi:hypothetical protein
MKPCYPLLATSFLMALATAARAEWVADFNGCGLELPQPSRYVLWDGQCKDGKAAGNGIARAANATRIEGEFRKGRPYDASGRFMAVMSDGTRTMARVSYARGQPTIAPLFDMTGRTRIDLTPLSGFWEWQVPGKCREKHEYRPDGDEIVSSGDHRIERLAQLYSVDGNPGWMEMVTTPLNQYGGLDCDGRKLEPLGDSERFYLRIDDQQNLWRCAAAEQQTCTAMAVRGVPDPPKERNLITSGGGIRTARNFGGSSSATGPLSATDQVFERNKGALYALYGRALRDNPKLAGKLVLDVDIDTTGKVTACRVKSSELNDADLERKIVARVNLIRFSAQEAPISIVKQLEFFPIE